MIFAIGAKIPSLADAVLMVTEYMMIQAARKGILRSGLA